MRCSSPCPPGRRAPAASCSACAARPSSSRSSRVWRTSTSTSWDRCAWSCSARPGRSGSSPAAGCSWMCKRAGLLLLLGAIAGRPLASQATDVPRLRARVDSLSREWARASAIADLADSLELQRAFSGRDTIAVGALRIVTDPSPLPVRAAAERAWPALDSLYGDAAQLLTRYPYVVRAFDPDTTAPRPTMYVGLAVPWDMSAAVLARLLVANAPMPPPDQALVSLLRRPPPAPPPAPAGPPGVYPQPVAPPSTPPPPR